MCLIWHRSISILIRLAVIARHHHLVHFWASHLDKPNNPQHWTIINADQITHMMEILKCNVSRTTSIIHAGSHSMPPVHHICTPEELVITWDSSLELYSLGKIVWGSTTMGLCFVAPIPYNPKPFCYPVEPLDYIFPISDFIIADTLGDDGTSFLSYHRIK